MVAEIFAGVFGVIAAVSLIVTAIYNPGAFRVRYVPAAYVCDYGYCCSCGYYGYCCDGSCCGYCC